MTLKQYIEIVRRRCWWLIANTLLAGVVAWTVSRSLTPMYQASITMWINPAPAGTAQTDYDALLAGERLAGTYSELLRKRPVLEQVITNLHLGTDPDLLEGRITINVIRDTQLIVLTVEDSNPQHAADIANELVKVFIEQNQELQARRYLDSKRNLQQELSRVQADIDQTQASIDALKTPTTPEQVDEQRRLEALLAQYRSSYTTLLDSFEKVRLAETQTTDILNVVERAEPAQQPVRPRTMQNTLLAMIVGAMSVLGLIFTLEYLDDSVKSSEDVEQRLGVPALVDIPYVPDSAVSGRLVAVANPRSPIAEAYRLLDATIEFTAGDTPVRTIVVTSGKSLEGKSTVAANLAVVMAQAGKRVILVDTDLRRPTLHTYFQQANTPGFTTALLQQEGCQIDDYLMATGIDNLRLMPSGPMPANPAALLAGQPMARLVEELKQQANVVVFDSAPLLAVVDAALLARACDATLLVARTGSTQATALERARNQLVQSGAHLLGVVLTGVAPEDARHDASSYYRDEGRRSGSLWQRLLGLPFVRLRNRSESPGAITTVDSAAVAGSHTSQTRVNGQGRVPKAASSRAHLARMTGRKTYRKANKA